MQQRRPKSRRLAAGIVALGCLIAGVCPPAARALDPGDGSTVSAQQIRRPLDLDSGKITRLDREPGKEPPGGEKAELSVYQLFAMHFGTLCDDDGAVTLGIADAITSDPDNIVYGGTPQSAVIRLNGDAFRAVSVDVAVGSTPGFQLGDFLTSYGAPPLSGLTLDATGYLTFSLGARLQLDSSVVDPGTGQPIAYTVIAVYE